MASENKAPQLIKVKLGKNVESHVHAGKELKAGDELSLTKEQIDRLKNQFGSDYFEGQ